jgi:hypothetical protein
MRRIRSRIVVPLVMQWERWKGSGRLLRYEYSDENRTVFANQRLEAASKAVVEAAPATTETVAGSIDPAAAARLYSLGPARQMSAKGLGRHRTKASHTWAGSDQDTESGS